MRFMRYRAGDATGLAASRDGAVWCGLEESHPRFPGSHDAVLGQPEALRAVGERLISEGSPVTPTDLELLLPLARPNRIFCIGLNYRDHIAETGMDAPEHLTVFTRFPQSLVPHDAALVRPRASTDFDYEAELAVVIGIPGKHIGRDRALSHVAGYTILNDGSLRDLQTRTSQWTLGKNADATGSMGPCLVTADALPAGGTPLRVTTKLNEEIVQDGDTADMVFDTARIIEEISRVITLEPGDVIATGTPAGVAMGAETPRWLRPGDRIAVTIEGIGTLENPVRDEAL